MTTAFQSNAFQNNAFQIDSGTTPTEERITGGGDWKDYSYLNPRRARPDEEPRKPLKAATTREKRKAVTRTLREILGVEAPGSAILTEASQKALAEAAQAQLAAAYLKAELADLEAMIARRYEEMARAEEIRRKRNATIALLLLAT